MAPQKKTPKPAADKTTAKTTPPVKKKAAAAKKAAPKKKAAPAKKSPAAKKPKNKDEISVQVTATIPEVMKEIIERASSVVTANDIASPTLRKKVLRWFTRK